MLNPCKDIKKSENQSAARCRKGGKKRIRRRRRRNGRRRNVILPWLGWLVGVWEALESSTGLGASFLIESKPHRSVKTSSSDQSSSAVNFRPRVVTGTKSEMIAPPHILVLRFSFNSQHRKKEGEERGRERVYVIICEERGEDL